MTHGATDLVASCDGPGGEFFFAVHNIYFVYLASVVFSGENGHNAIIRVVSIDEVAKVSLEVCVDEKIRENPQTAAQERSQSGLLFPALLDSTGNKDQEIGVP